MIPIGPMPIIWHVMRFFNKFGIRDFIICLGYKQDVVRDFFLNYQIRTQDVTINLKSGEKTFLKATETEDWNVTLIDTGLETMTGGRLKRIEKYLQKEKPFFMTYCDGLSNHSLIDQFKFHTDRGKKATVLASLPQARFGALEIDNGIVQTFQEKPRASVDFINGGYFILEPSVLELIKDDATIWENEPLENLTSAHELSAYIHNEFWECMDTMRDFKYLNKLYDTNNCPWI